MLCEHLLISIYQLSDLLLSDHKSADAWINSRKKCIKKGIYYTANWLYYFIKHIFSQMNFRVALFEEPSRALGLIMSQIIDKKK